MSRPVVGPGLALATVLALPATWLGSQLPLLGGPLFGIALGVAAGSVVRRAVPTHVEKLRPGLLVAGHHVLQAAIVVMGFTLPLPRVVSIGRDSMPVLVGTLTVALGGAWLLRRALRLDADTATLIGVGTAICGASAIAAVTAVIRPTQERVAYALATILTFNVVAVLGYPALGHLLDMSSHAFGLWAGTAINDTSSVVAAAAAFGPDASDYAVVVKLTRSLVIVPICVVLQIQQARRTGSRSLWRAIPVFLLGFLAASVVSSLGVLPDAAVPVLTWLSTFLVTTALAGIGMTLDLGGLRTTGPRPILFGGILAAAVSVTSLGIQEVTGQM